MRDTLSVCAALMVLVCGCDSAPPPRPTEEVRAQAPAVVPAPAPAPEAAYSPTATLTVTACTAVAPNWKPGRWSIYAKVDIAGDSREVVQHLANQIRFIVEIDPARFASMHEVGLAAANRPGGPAIPLAGEKSSWKYQYDPETEAIPLVHWRRFKLEDVVRRGDGLWTVSAGAPLVCERQPTGTVSIVLNGEEIRRAIVEWSGGASTAIGVGGLVGVPAEVVMPAPSAPEPPVAGSGIGGL